MINKNNSNNFQILSLSGGGYRGLYTIAVLAELEKELSKPIAQYFDLIAGTSIGGIIAIALALEVPCEEILDEFLKSGSTIFSEKKGKGLFSQLKNYKRYLRLPKHKANGLKSTVNKILGDDTILGDALHPVMIPTVNVTTGKPQFFKTPHHKEFKKDWKQKATDIALATSAAPHFFPLAEIEDCFYADGGLYANSPDLAAIHEATHFFKAETSRISLLSIGTTLSRVGFSNQKGKELGILDWLKGLKLLEVMYSCQQQDIDFIVKHKLENRYFRVDTELSEGQQKMLGLDVVTPEAQKLLLGLGKNKAQEIANSKILKSFYSHQPDKLTFFYGKHSSGD